jgi:hypothetical protein
LVSPEVCWLDFVQTIATLNGFEGSGASAAIADADIVKTVSARIIILPPLLKRKKNTFSGKLFSHSLGVLQGT